MEGLCSRIPRGARQQVSCLADCACYAPLRNPRKRSANVTQKSLPIFAVPTIRANRQLSATNAIRLPVRLGVWRWSRQGIETGYFGGCWSPLKLVISGGSDVPSTFASRLDLKRTSFLQAGSYQHRRTNLKGVKCKAHREC